MTEQIISQSRSKSNSRFGGEILSRQRTGQTNCRQQDQHSAHLPDVRLICIFDTSIDDVGHN